MSAAHQALDLDIDSLGRALGPAGLHEFLDAAIVRPVMEREARAEARQRAAGAAANAQACISPKGLFALDATYDGFAFHDIVQAVGREEVEQGEVLDDLAKKYGSAVVVRSRPRKASIIVPATKYTKVSLS